MTKPKFESRSEFPSPWRNLRGRSWWAMLFLSLVALTPGAARGQGLPPNMPQPKKPPSGLPPSIEPGPGPGVGSPFGPSSPALPPSMSPDSLSRPTIEAPKGPSVMEREVLTKAEAAFKQLDFKASKSMLDERHAAATKEGRPILERWIALNQQAAEFLNLLCRKIADAPKAVAAVDVMLRTKDMAVTRVTGARDAVLLVEMDGASQEIVPQDLAPASLAALAKKYTFTAEESVPRAAFLLTIGDAKEIDAALVKASENGNLRPQIDGLIAIWRRLDVVPEWGFFRVENEWITFREREERIYDKQVKAAVAKLEQGDKSYEKGITELNDLLAVAPHQIAKELAPRRSRMIAQLLAQPEWKSFDRLSAERQKLEEARKHALELIFDEVKYFYPYASRQAEYAVVQKEVDERVAKVRAIWGDEHGAPPPGVPVSAGFRKLTKLIASERGLLALSDPSYDLNEPGTERLDLLPVDVSTITIRDFAVDYAERQRLDQDRQVLAMNEQVKTSGTPDDVLQVRITNEYRRMMGRHALAIHEKLMRSAHGHSEWMSLTGKFSHTNDENPKLRTPGDRMRAQGYSSGAGENIAMTGGGARGAHEGWIHSSGHHRNILFESHTEMGVGSLGNIWTQNFGGGQEYIGNLGGAGVIDDK